MLLLRVNQTIRIFKSIHILIKIVVLAAVLTALIPVISVARHAYNDLVALKSLQTQLDQKQHQYVEAVKLLTQEKWAEARSTLDTLQDYKDAGVLRAYAKARELFEQKDFLQALEELKKIPDNYNGQFSAGISNFRQTLYKEYANLSGKTEQQLAKRLKTLEASVRFGMKKIFKP